MLVIDGYNVLFKIFGGEDVGEDLGKYRRLTVERINAFETEREKWVVFDGRKSRRPKKSETFGSVKVLYSTPPQSADELIASLCRKYGERVVLITSDRELIGKVRGLIKGVMLTQTFCTALPVRSSALC